MSWTEHLPLAANVATVVVAVVALGVAFLQAHIARNHNMLSVRPMLQLHRKWETFNDCSVLLLELVNNGLGPGKVTSIKLMDGKIEITLNDKNTHKIKLAFEKIIGKGLTYDIRSMGWPTDKWINIGERVLLAEVVFKPIFTVRAIQGGISDGSSDSVKSLELSDFVECCEARGTNYTVLYSWESMYGEHWSDDRIY